MGRKTYSELLSSPKWKAKREDVFRKKGKHCNRCLITKRLQIHHRYYSFGYKPWEYPDDCFEVLCASCHSEEHGRSTSKFSSRKSGTFSKKSLKGATKKPVRGRVLSVPVSFKPANPEKEEKRRQCRQWFWCLLVGGIFFGQFAFDGGWSFLFWLVGVGVFGCSGYLSDEGK